MNVIQFWNNLCQVTTNDVKLAGLRNALFTCYGLPLLNTLKTQFVSVFYIFKYIFRKVVSTKVFENNYDGSKYLIYIPFSTSSNIGNLDPVIKLLLHHKKEVAIISGEKVKHHNYNNHHNYAYSSIINNTRFSDHLFSIFISFIQTTKFLIRALNYRCLVSFTISNIGVILYNIYLINIHYKALDNFFVRKPEVLLSTSEYFPFDYVLFSYLNENKCATYLLQHGTIGISHFPFISGKLITWGKYFSNQFISMGAEKSRLIEGGMPSSDDVFLNGKKILNHNNKQRIKILILSETHAEYLYPIAFKKYREILKELLDRTEDTSIEWIIKLHPSEDDSFYVRNKLIAYRNLKILDKKTSLVDSFNESNLALTLFSTAGIQAMMFGLPLFVLWIGKDDFQAAVDWPDSGGGVYLRSAEQLVEILNSPKQDLILSQILENQSCFLRESYSYQGCSAEKIAEILGCDQNEVHINTLN